MSRKAASYPYLRLWRSELKVTLRTQKNYLGKGDSDMRKEWCIVPAYVHLSLPLSYS